MITTLEKDLEAKFRKRVDEAGCKALKFISPGNSGVPDRLVLIPGGRVCFVELKQEGKKPRAIQERMMRELKKLGFDTYIIDNLQGIEVFVNKIESWRWDEGDD